LHVNKSTGKTNQKERHCLMRMVPEMVKRSRKVPIALAGCAMLLSAALPATTAMAAPIPQSGNSCGPQIVGAQECTAIVGTGLKITSISGTLYNNSPAELYDVYIEFYGPNGYITKTATYDIPAWGHIGGFVWHNPNPNANMTAGDYCTQGAGHSDCVDVHS
jgi:hypothetical protein